MLLHSIPRFDRAWTGAVGEELVARALVRAGWRVLARNVDAREAELDAVAEDAGTTVVLEVKSGLVGRWPPAPGAWRPADRVTRRDLRRRRRAARRIAGRGPARVDVVEAIAVRTEGSRRLRWLLVHHRGVDPGATLPWCAEPSPRNPPRGRGRAPAGSRADSPSMREPRRA